VVTAGEQLSYESDSPHFTYFFTDIGHVQKSFATDQRLPSSFEAHIKWVLDEHWIQIGASFMLHPAAGVPWTNDSAPGRGSRRKLPAELPLRRSTRTVDTETGIDSASRSSWIE